MKPKQAKLNTKTEKSDKVAITEVKAKAKNVRISPRKMRLVTNLIKGLNVEKAKQQLAFSNKKAATILLPVLNSAIANAKNNFKLDTEKLFVKTATADMGQVMKRYFPRARGSAFIIRRKNSHVNITLGIK